MGLLDDLTKLQFGQGLADSIRDYRAGMLVNQLQSALKEVQASTDEPIPRADAEKQAIDKASTYPSVDSSGLPQIQRELDRVSQRIRKQSDIYGKFIPAIAMMNPGLAKVIAEEQIRQEGVAFEPIKERVGLAETGARITSNELMHDQALREKAYEFDQMMEWRRSQVKQKGDYQKAYLGLYGKAIDQYKLPSLVLKSYNDYQDNVANLTRQRDDLVKKAADEEMKIKTNPLMLDANARTEAMNSTVVPIYNSISQLDKQIEEQQKVLDNVIKPYLPESFSQNSADIPKYGYIPDWQRGYTFDKIEAAIREAGAKGVARAQAIQNLKKAGVIK